MRSRDARLVWILAALLLVATVAVVGCTSDTTSDDEPTTNESNDVPSEPADDDASDEPADDSATDDSATDDDATDDDAIDDTDAPTEARAEGDLLIDSKCTRCHSRIRTDSAQKDRAGWEAAIDRMVGYGATVTDAERAAIIDYLLAE